VVKSRKLIGTGKAELEYELARVLELIGSEGYKGIQSLQEFSGDHQGLTPFMVRRSETTPKVNIFI
jgi:hypothetical protein